jgi:hypothetical protein
MKKVYMLGMMLTLAACFAFAASLSVPWFIDTATPPSKLPPVGAGVVGLVYLHNNLEDDIVCEIGYYTSTGTFMGPVAPAQTTFTIPALSTVAFRPCQDDPPVTGSGGQETEVARAVPNRPTVSPLGVVDTKPNGSLVVRWTTGGSSDVQGIVLQTQNVDGGATGRVLQWGTLLPPGT